MRVCVVRFMDSASVDWRVQEESVPVPGRLQRRGRWFQRRLRFESELGVRFLAPVPDGWEDLPPSALELLSSMAAAGHHRAA